MPHSSLTTFWQNLRPLVAPVLLLVLVVLILQEPVAWWLHGEEKFDQEAVKEWIREARVLNDTLPELVHKYLDLVERHRAVSQKLAAGGQALEEVKRLKYEDNFLEGRLALKREEVLEHLKSLGTPPTKMYPNQLPLFPIIYRLSVDFDANIQVDPIFWDSELPRQMSQFRTLTPERLDDRGAFVNVQYHLHAYTQRQAKERLEVTRRLWLSGLGIFFTLLALIWIYITQRRDRERQRQHILAEQQVVVAQRLRLEEELRRQEAERRQQEAEHQTLELKSQLFANIGIMAGSYAHNIKNLLVRPNDLLRRCLDEQPAGPDQAHMLREVRQTLGTVTERLQQILQTVRRDPSKSESVRIDLNVLVGDMQRTWSDLAREKWKLDINLDMDRSGPLWIQGDLSHLQQALENLVFNARDATFEMRNHLREQARRMAISGEPAANPHLQDQDKRQALIAAAAWKGSIVLRTRREGEHAILEVIDNGIGMTEEVRRRCSETHFSTKRNNALFAGLSAGMGLGLSFVTVILEHHRASMEIASEPWKGATFRVSLPLAAAS